MWGLLMHHTVLSIAGFAYLACFILMLIAMYQHKQTILMIVCIVLVFVIGVGSIIAFVYGWMNAMTWKVLNIPLLTIMYVWSAALIVLFFYHQEIRALIPFSR